MKLSETRSAVPFRPLPYYLGHLFIYLGLVIIILALAWLGLRLQRLYSSYRLAGDHLAALAEATAGSDLGQLQTELRAVTASLERLQQEAAPFMPLSRSLAWLPGYGADLQALPALLAAGREVGRAGLLLADLLEPAAADAEPRPELLSRLQQARPELQQAEARLRQQQVALAALEPAQLSAPLAGRLQQLERFLPSAIAALQLSQGLPALLGADGPRTYLILTQNSDELRPAGGYITTAGHVVFAEGRLVDFVMQDSYAVDRLSAAYPYPPAPLYEYMAADYWVLRDASWSPDFPSAARTAIELYALGQNVAATGVVALDQQALPYLLQAIGPLEVAGERVTAANVIPLLRQHWAPQPGQALDSAWWSQRKSFMLALADQIRQRLELELAPGQFPGLATALAQALAEKHLLIHLEEPPEQAALLAEQNWNGALAPTRGDYLMVVDANVGFNKASALVERQLQYRASLTEAGQVQAQLKLTYHHPAEQTRPFCRPEMRYEPIYEQNMARCYWNYLQLVVPAGAQLGRGPAIVVDGRQLLRGQATGGDIQVAPLPAAKTSWGQLFVLAPQQRLTLAYDYTLPAGTARRLGDHWLYRLYLQKQPGTAEPAAEVTIHLPAGAQLLRSQPQPASQAGAAVTYQLRLRRDEQIEITYRLAPERE